MKRVWHPYHVWEEYKNGMWKHLPNEKEVELLAKAVEFTGNAELYGSYMMRAIKEWPISCEHNLTASNINRQAWIGHAACCIAIGCPEHITRQAWWILTEKQRIDANLQADKAIQKWEQSQFNENQLCLSESWGLTF